MKFFALLSILSVALLLTSFTRESSAPPARQIVDCKYNGHNLWGKIQYVTSFPDVTVEVVDSFPDLNVQMVPSFPDACGKWQEVTSFPDLKVQVVTSLGDVKIKYVSSFPGRP